MNKQYMMNLIAAASDNFFDTLAEVDNSLFETINVFDYSRYVWSKVNKCWFKRSKVKYLVSATAAIYNNCMIANPNIWYTTTILLEIIDCKLYSYKKYRNFITSKKHLRFLIPGVKYDKLKIFEILEDGIDAVNS